MARRSYRSSREDVEGLIGQLGRPPGILEPDRGLVVIDTGAAIDLVRLGLGNQAGVFFVFLRGQNRIRRF